MPGTNFIPTRESDLVTWANNFEAKISANPTRYGLTAAMATAFTALHATWNTTYAAANDPVTRSPSNIVAKNNAKAAMIDGENGIRKLAAIVQSTQGLPTDYISELGLTVRDTEPTPIPPPTVAPEIDFINTGTRIIKIRLHNEKALNRRKPAGVSGATVFSYVGETAPNDLDDWKFEFNTTKTTFEIDPPASVQPGTTMWFTAFWFNPRAQSGPATTPVSTVVQYGGLKKAA